MGRQALPTNPSRVGGVDGSQPGLGFKSVPGWAGNLLGTVNDDDRLTRERSAVPEYGGPRKGGPGPPAVGDHVIDLDLGHVPGIVPSRDEVNQGVPIHPAGGVVDRNRNRSAGMNCNETQW